MSIPTALGGLLGALALALSAPASAQLLANGDFDTGVEPWADPFPDPGTIIVWHPSDASGDPGSGSLQVETNIPGAALDGPASECFAVGEGVHTATARVFVESSAGQQASAVVAINFYDTTNCSGGAFDVSFGGSSTQLDAWESLLLEAETPDGGRGARLRLLVGSTSDSVWDIARFDEVQYVPEPEQGAAASVWALATTLYSRRRSTRGGSRRSETAGASSS